MPDTFQTECNIMRLRRNGIEELRHATARA
jgi:hypothetical protein